MKTNHINATLDPAAVDKIMAAIAVIKENLPFLIDLSAEERKTLPRFGNKSYGFTIKSAVLGDQHPEILPGNFDMAEFQQVVKLLTDIYPIRTAVEQLFGQISDTVYAIGSDAYSGALHIYNYAKAANLYTGALEDTLDDLARRFARRASGGSGTPTPAAGSSDKT